MTLRKGRIYAFAATILVAVTFFAFHYVLPPGVPESASVLSLSDEAAISAAIGKDSAGYHIQADGQNYAAANADHHYGVSFGERGAVIKDSEGSSSFTLSLPNVIYQNPEISDNRISYNHGAITEWYINGPKGLEQGFTVASPLSSQALLELSLSMENVAATTINENKTSVSIATTGGRTFVYGGLFAVDAKGKTLPAWFEQRGNRLAILTDTSQATYPITIDPFIEEQKLTASDGAASDNFGWNVALSADGTRLGVGAYGDDSYKGSAYIFSRSGTTWTQEQKLTASDGAADDLFGVSIALSDDGSRAVVGASGDDLYEGAAYIFSRSGTTWTQEQKLIASDALADDRFGGSVSISADATRVVAGAYMFFTGRPGSAYVFSRSGTTWTQEQELTASDAGADDAFGASVTLSTDGTRTAVGASADNSYRGSVYIFSRSGTTWTQEQRLAASDAADNDGFGTSVAFSEDHSRVAVGATGDDLLKGSAYIFSRSGTTWTQEQKLTGSDSVADDFFGYAVGLSDDATRVAVGAGMPLGGRKGAIYTFSRSGTTWTQDQKLTASDGANEDYFGGTLSISADGNRVAVGANGDDSIKGSAYVFAIPQYTLTVTTSGAGSGTVTSNTGGIDCGATCTANYNENTSVVLTATPVTGSAASEWSGDADCSDGTVTMSSAVSCSVSFVIIQHVSVGNSVPPPPPVAPPVVPIPPVVPPVINPPTLPPVQNPTSPAGIQALINAILQQVAALQAKLLAQQGNTINPPNIVSFFFNKNLSSGMTDLEVLKLQQYLNSHGFMLATTGPGSVGNETTKFGAATKAALIKFQEFHAAEILTPAGLTKGTGIFGASTRAYINGHQ